MRVRIAGMLFLLALTSAPAFVQDQQTLILEHANIVNPLSDQPLLDQTIVISEGKIRSLSQAPTTISGERIDLCGALELGGDQVGNYGRGGLPENVGRHGDGRTWQGRRLGCLCRQSG